MTYNPKPEQRRTLKDSVKDDILELLSSEEFRPGVRFYSERELAKHFKVTQLTVRAALDLVEEAGYLERRPRSGTYVRRCPQSTVAGNLVAVVISATAHLYADLWDGLSSSLQAAGYLPLSVAALRDAGPDLVLRQLAQIREMGCRRIIIADDTRYWEATLAQSLCIDRESTHPWAQIIWLLARDRLPEHILGNTITVHAEAQCDAVLQHLTEQGHRRIAYVTYELVPDQSYPWHQTWLESHYCQSMCRAGLGAMIQVIHQTNNDEANVHQIKALMAEPNRPTAFVASSDSRLLVVEQALTELGLGIPGDAALVGNLDTPWATQRGYSSVSCEIASICRETVALLQTGDTDSRIMVTPRLVVRASSAAMQTAEEKS